MAPSETLPAELRVDGIWWRKFARLGSVYGPEWWKRYSPPVIAAFIFLLIGPNRRGAIANMRHVLGADIPGAAPLGALRMFVEFAHCMVETFEYFGPKAQPVRVDLPDPDLLAEVLKEGRGAIVVTGHFGNWDLAAKRLLIYGRPVTVVMAQEADSRMSEYLRRMREASDVRIVYSDASLFSSLDLVNTLRRGEIVAMQLDRTTAVGRSIEVPFFGADAKFAAGPFHLARVAKAPILAAFAVRVGVRHYAIRYGSICEVARSQRGKGIAPIAAEIVADFESVVREFPSQWFQFSEFWRESGESGVRPGPRQSAPGLLRQVGRAARSRVRP